MQNTRKYLFMIATALGVVACNSGGSSSSVSPTPKGWTWIGGSNQTNSASNYQSNTANPGARDLAVSWVDNNGNFWLFGGYGYAASQTESGYLNDLWKYNPTSKIWTLVSGQESINTYGIYGQIGIESSNNNPGSRIGAVSWQDESGNLWMFGGFGYAKDYRVGIGSPPSIGTLNDLWKFNISSGQWTWMSGESIITGAANYGAKGIANVVNTPGGRLGAVSWLGNDGNLWMFGGEIANPLFSNGLYVPATNGDYNDLWKYNPNTNMWTWVSGSRDLDSYGVYGVQGVTSSVNQPGSRLDSVGWTDESGNLWLFGGNGYDGIGSVVGDLNDLWKYDPINNQWTWMSGANMTNQNGVYEQLGVSSPNSIPGAREHRIPIAWVDNTGSFWMMGGDGYGNSTKGILNDVWKYNPNNNQWTWMNGTIESNAFSNYGSKGVGSTTNQLGARRDSIGWINSDGVIVIFGGEGNTSNQTGLLNDMWQFTY